MTALNHNAADGNAAVNQALFSAPPPDGALSGDGSSDKAPLTELTVGELKALAKSLGLSGCGTMNKADLIAAVSAVSGTPEV